MDDEPQRCSPGKREARLRMTLSWGLIGAGDIARRRIAPALVELPTCTLHGVSRARADLAESFALEFGARRWYHTWRALLDDEDIEAVYIATPVQHHAAQAIAAAEAGKHVLCEKPMGMDVRECDGMIAACRANDVTLGIAYYRHHYPVIERIKEIIAEGEIGDVVLAQINAFEWFDPPNDHPRRWLIEKEAGGGPMFDFGCHRLEILVNLLGPVRRVVSSVGNVVFDRAVEDTAVAVLEHERGARATLCVTHAVREAQDTLDLFGTLGSLHVARLNDGVLRVVAGGVERMEALPPHANIHLPLIADFADAVLSGREPRVFGEIGRTVARLEELIYNC